MKRTDLPERFQKLLKEVPYVAIATTCPDDSPWNTPVAGFRYDDYTFYWASWTDNQHSRNIRNNGNAFIVVFDSTPASGQPSQGIYIQSHATELSDEQEVMKAAQVFGGDPFNPADGKEYLGSKPRRIYKAVPQKIWHNKDGEVDGNFVDVRKLIFEEA